MTDLDLIEQFIKDARRHFRRHVRGGLLGLYQDADVVLEALERVRQPGLLPRKDDDGEKTDYSGGHAENAVHVHRGPQGDD